MPASLASLWIYTPSEFLIALAIVVAGGVVRGFTGFGSGLVMAPLLAILWGPVEAIATMVALGTAATVQLVPRALPATNWRDVAPMMIASTVAAPIGTSLLVSLDPHIVKKIIAAFVLAATLITMAGWQYRGPRGPLAASVAGALTGLINGVAGVGGPATVLYLISLPDKPDVHRANIVTAMASATVVVFVTMALHGVVGQRILTHIVVFLVPSIASVWLGAHLFGVLPQRLFKMVVLWFLVAVSAAILLS